MLKAIKDLYHRARKPSGKLGNRLKVVGGAMIGTVIGNEYMSTIEPDTIIRVIEALTVFVGSVTALIGALMLKPK